MASVPTRVRRALPGPLSPDRVRRGAYVLGATCIVAVAAWLVFKWSRLPVDAELQRVGRSPALPVLTITSTSAEITKEAAIKALGDKVNQYVIQALQLQK